MASLLSAFSGAAEATVVPMIFKFIETQEPMLEDALVDQLNKLKTSNPNQFNVFITNWRKINAAMERSAQIPAAPVVAPAVPPVVAPVVPPPPPPTGGTAMGVVPAVPEPTIPSPPVEEKTDTAGTRKRRRHKKRTHKVKHRKH